MMEASSLQDSASTPLKLPDRRSERPAFGVYLALVAGFAAIGMSASVDALRPLFVLLSLALTAAVCLLAVRARPTLTDVLVVAVIGRVLLIPLMPTLSDDAFRYIWDGMLPWHGFNPFLLAPVDEALESLQRHPVFSELNSTSYHTVYPPVSQILFGMWGWIPPAGWPIAYLMTKVTFVALECGAVLLLAKMVRPERLVIYAWNPLVIVETAGQLHTETALVFFLVGCVYALRRNRPGLSVAAITAAVWVKLYPVFLLPFLLRRVGWKWTGLVAALSAALVIPYYAPGLVAGPVESLNLYTGYFEFYSGPYLLLKTLAYRYDLFSSVERTLALVLAIGFLMTVSALFLMDTRKSGRLPAVFCLVLGSWYVFSTTVHPWYFLGILAVLPVVGPARPSWIWLSAISTVTYLHYTHDFYWPAVWIGWGGWLLIAASSSDTVKSGLDSSLQRIMKSRGRDKARLVRPYLRYESEELARPLAVLDLGAGEGYVGEALQSEAHCAVTLCEVRDANRTGLPQVLYDGYNLPFGDKWFDTTILVFTLHHCEDHVQVLREAARVTSGRVVILESVFETEIGRRVLDVLDRGANWLRSPGGMDGDRHFRKTEDWVELLETMGFRVESVRTWGRIHRQALLVAEVPSSIH